MRSSKTYGTIDIGNTFTKLALFHMNEDGKYSIVSQKKIKHLKVDALENWEAEHAIDKIAYCASGRESKEVLAYLHRHNDALLLTHEVPMPIEIMYKTPETLGKDRIAAVLGGRALFPDENLVIIDLGTCITYEWLTKEGQYKGGNISPGIHMRLRAMHEFTANLPLADWKHSSNLIGTSTATALINGAVTGTICEIETFIGRTHKELGKYTVLLTGGDAEKISPLLSIKHTIHQGLIHTGLCELIQYNNEEKK